MLANKYNAKERTMVVNRLKYYIYNLLLYFLRKDYRITNRYMRLYKYCTIREKVVLLEAYQATRISCSPYAIFKHMIDHPDFQDFTFVWAIGDSENYYVKKYAARRNVKFCKKNSAAYLMHLASAKYLVNNKTFPAYFIKKPEQVYLNTWHGIALKTLGKDQKGSMGQYRNAAVNFLHTDYLVVPDKFMADVLLNCTDTQTFYPGWIVDEGYPRTDLSYNTPMAEMKAFLEEQIHIDVSQKLVLYAPTWRGEVGASIDITGDVLKNVEELNRTMPEGYLLLLKIHDRTYTFVKENPSLQKIVNVPDWIDTNELLAGIDILITDYSSIFFDFLKLDRPIIFYAYDREYYEAERGMYMDYDDMPGPICATAKEVTDAIADMDRIYRQYREKREAMLATYCYREDGHCTERVVDIAFRGKTSAHTERVTCDRQKVLAYMGSPQQLKDAGNILESLNAADFSRYDITVYLDKNPAPGDETYLKTLDERIHLFYGCRWYMNRSYDFHFKDSLRRGALDKRLSEEAVLLYIRHALADVKFDICINLTGDYGMWDLALPLVGKRSAALPKKSAKGIRTLQAARTYDIWSEVPAKEMNGEELMRLLAPLD
jgi:CDP-glycerol glycerophosphotransferase